MVVLAILGVLVVAGGIALTVFGVGAELGERAPRIELVVRGEPEDVTAAECRAEDLADYFGNIPGADGGADAE